MSTNYKIGELHGNLVDRLRSSGVDRKTAERQADSSIRRVESTKDREAVHGKPPPPKRD